MRRVRADLARIHHLAFGFHADACAPGIPARLELVRGGTSAGEGSWRRDDERYDNVLVDTAGVPALLAHGVEATVGAGFGDRRLAGGMVAVTVRRG